MKNLTSISEHSDYLENTFTFDAIKWDLHRKRVEFGKQPLAIWMFVPCDEDVNVLEEPLKRDYNNVNINNSYFKQYQKAKERCLFERFRYDGFKYLDYKNYSFRILEIKNMTIENLVKYNPELTQTALKTLGL